MARTPTTTVLVELPTKLVEQSKAVLAGRGSSLDDFVRLKLKGLLRPEKFYAQEDRYTFGKYKDEFVGTIIRTDPSYVAWCLREIEGFGLDPAALELLSETGEDL